MGIDADTKLIPSWLVGGRDASYAEKFITDLAGRLTHRGQLTSDGHKLYLEAVWNAFHGNIDYAMLIKLYSTAYGERNTLFTWDLLRDTKKESLRSSRNGMCRPVFQKD